MEIDNWDRIDESFGIDDSRMFSAKSFKIDYFQEKGLNPNQLQKLRMEWIRVLPKLDTVEFAYFGHPVNQEFFSAICQMPKLKGLWIKVSRFDDFSKIGNLINLHYLNVKGSVKITSLKGVEHLNELRSLELNGFFGIKDIEEIRGLKKLERLMIFGNLEGKKLNIKSIDAVEDLKNLKLLALEIKSKEVNLDPISKLTKLERLII